MTNKITPFIVTKKIALILGLLLIFATPIYLLNPRVKFSGHIEVVNASSIIVVGDIGSKYEGRYSIHISKDTKIYDKLGNKIVVSDLKRDEYIKITFDGNIFESYPSQIKNCYKIIVLE